MDGSEPSLEALRYACLEATRWETSLRVVCTFESSGLFGDRYGLPIPVSDQTIAERLLTQADGWVKEALEAFAKPPATEITVQAGSASVLLVEQSRQADLLVVGHRGHGGLLRSELGSVALHCVSHGHCPVTVVRSFSA